MSTAANSSRLTAEGTAAYKEEVEAAASVLPSFQTIPAVGLLHDADLNRLLDAETADRTISYADLPHFPAADGTLTTGTLDGTTVVEMTQALHLYDGHTPREVAFPVRMLATAGIDTLLLTAPAGSVTASHERGDLMLLTDHINFQGQNPLVGPNVEAWGPRFPDMTEPYTPALRRTTVAVARDEGIPLRKGIYLALLGPNAETSAEHRMAQRLGADAVGTSVVPEVIAARHMDLRVMALTVLRDQHLTADRPSPSAEDGRSLQGARSRLHRLLTGVVARLGADEATT